MTEKGIRCPLCNCGHHSVQKTYPEAVFETHGKRVTTIRRRRVCRHCKAGWYTVERNEESIILEESQDSLQRFPPDIGGEP